ADQERWQPEPRVRVFLLHAFLGRGDGNTDCCLAYQVTYRSSTCSHRDTCLHNNMSRSSPINQPWCACACSESAHRASRYQPASHHDCYLRPISWFLKKDSL